MGYTLAPKDWPSPSLSHPPDLLFAENDDWFRVIPHSLKDVLNVIRTSNQLYLLSLHTVAAQQEQL